MKNIKQKCSYCGFPKIYAKGLCKNCYVRNLRNGTPEKKERKTTPSEKQKLILEMYDNTKNVADAAKKCGCSREYVYALIRAYKKNTNADCIRAMTDEELATWLGDMLGVYPFGTDQWDRQAWLDWLKKEVEE